MAMGFGEKVQADIKRLAITERLQLLKWMQTMVDEDLARQGAVAVEQGAGALKEGAGVLDAVAHATPAERSMLADHNDIQAAARRKGSALMPELDDLTYKINGCGLAVHRQLGSGLREDTYQRAMEAQFAKAGSAF